MRSLSVLVATLVSLNACRAFEPPTVEFLATLRPRDSHTGAFIRQRFRVSVQSPDLAGEFEGALLAETGPGARVRLQLFPDLGAKVLDLVSTPNLIEIRGANDERTHRHPLPPPRRIEPTFPFLLAVTLHEHFSGLDAARVTGVRPLEDGWELRLRPHPSGVEVTVRIDSERRVRGRTYEYGWIDWREHAGTPLRFTARRFELTLRDLQEDTLATVPDQVFTLTEPVAP